VVTGWLGADMSGAKPHVATFAPDGAGVVLLCSDGLWNYEQDAAALAARALPAAQTDPLTVAGELVTFAIEAGGSDNITVVLVPFPPKADPDQPAVNGADAELSAEDEASDPDRTIRRSELAARAARAGAAMPTPSASSHPDQGESDQ